MVKLTKEDENKLGQILKELNEVREILKGGEGSGIKGHKTEGVKTWETMTGDERRREIDRYANRKRIEGYKPIGRPKEFDRKRQPEESNISSHSTYNL